MILAHNGKTIDSRGDDSLLADLRKEARDEYKKRRLNQASSSTNDSIFASSDIASPISPSSSFTNSQREENKAVSGGGNRPERQLSREAQHDKIMKQVRAKMQPHNVYIHPCNNSRCRGYG